jgi:hypothetical protein
MPLILCSPAEQNVPPEIIRRGVEEVAAVQPDLVVRLEQDRRVLEYDAVVGQERRDHVHEIALSTNKPTNQPTNHQYKAHTYITTRRIHSTHPQLNLVSHMRNRPIRRMRSTQQQIPKLVLRRPRIIEPVLKPLPRPASKQHRHPEARGVAHAGDVHERLGTRDVPVGEGPVRDGCVGYAEDGVQGVC